MLKHYVFYLTFCFIILFVLSVPFDYNFLPDITDYTARPFEWLVNQTLILFNLQPSTIESDTRGMYIDLFLVAICSLLVSALTFRQINKTDPLKRIQRFQTVVSYYLVLQLLIYGFAKLFKAQFFLPEPNILFTNVGDVNRDLLYWTAIGTSRSYSIFLGVTEILAAALLFFPKTRLIGGVLSAGILVNVFAINLSFDISVKVYSLFLLVCSLFILMPYFSRLYLVFFTSEKSNLKLLQPIGNNRMVYALVRAMLIMIFLFESAGNYFITGNLNDDLADRPVFHGAYQIKNSDAPWKMCFVNRGGYLIFQAHNEKMTDLKMTVDQENKTIFLEDYSHYTYTFKYDQTNGKLTRLVGRLGTDSIDLSLISVPTAKLTLFQNEFRWYID